MLLPRVVGWGTVCIGIVAELWKGVFLVGFVWYAPL